MKILLLSDNQINRYNWTHQLFRNEISRHHSTLYYGPGYINYSPEKLVPEVVKELGPFDLILTYGLKYSEKFIGLGEITNIPKAHIAVDYFPVGGGSGTYERNHKLFTRDKYDLYFGVVGDIVRNLEKNGVCKKAFLLPFSIDINIYKNLNLKKYFDVFASFTTRNDIYPNREKIHSLLRSMRPITSYIKRVEHENYINKINRSRICITSNNKFRSLSIKYYETMACGSFLLADKPEDFDELGYVDGRHLVLYNDLNDLKDKIYFYLKNGKTREKIALQGMDFVRTFHNNEIRVNEFTNIIQKELNIK